MDSRTERYEAHPAADVFPMLSDSQLDELGLDIETNGQHEAIVLFEGKILDGRNRHEACLRKKLKPSFVELEECDDPIGYVIGSNLHRRHLTESQRAMCAAKLAGLKNGRPSKETPQICGVIPASQAAELFQVSTRTVETALNVIRNCGTDVVKLCEQGEVKVSAAAKLATQVEDKKEQNKIAKNGSAAIKEAVKPKERTKPKKTLSETLPPKASVSEVAEVERWIEVQDERPFFERFKAIWDMADEVGRSAIRAFILSE